MGQLSDIILGKIVNPKYEDPESTIVIVNIKSVYVNRPRIKNKCDDKRYHVQLKFVELIEA